MKALTIASTQTSWTRAHCEIFTEMEAIIHPQYYVYVGWGCNKLFL